MSNTWFNPVIDYVLNMELDAQPGMFLLQWAFIHDQ